MSSSPISVKRNYETVVGTCGRGHSGDAGTTKPGSAAIAYRDDRVRQSLFDARTIAF